MDADLTVTGHLWVVLWDSEEDVPEIAGPFSQEGRAEAFRALVIQHNNVAPHDITVLPLAVPFTWLPGEEERRG